MKKKKKNRGRRLLLFPGKAMGRDRVDVNAFVFNDDGAAAMTASSFSCLLSVRVQNKDSTLEEVQRGRQGGRQGGREGGKNTGHFSSTSSEKVI